MAPGPTMLPYRENGAVKYVPAPFSFPTHPLSASTYDSDNEPLLVPSVDIDIDEDALQRFTATGRPMPSYQHSNLGGSMYLAPQLLPQRYTDESIIPVIVVGVLPTPSTTPAVETPPPSRRKSFLSKLKPCYSSSNSSTKVVYMPRGEYLKHFARDRQGAYVGSEPEQKWTVGELEERFGRYRRKGEKKTTGYEPPY
jgi:hypothetical protein